MFKNFFLCCSVFIMLSLLTSCAPEEDFLDANYAKIYLFIHGESLNSLRYEVFTLSNYSSTTEGVLEYSVRQSSVDSENKLMAPSPIKIDNQVFMQNQCGEYVITINMGGEINQVTIPYKGEENLVVGRGIGWSMYISRENWGNK